MSTTLDLVTTLKAELKAAQVTYADLAGHLRMSESSIKRIFAKGDMPLSRIDEVLRVLKMDFAELARKVADAQPLRSELTLEQEKAVVADRRLLLMAICCMSQWTLEEILGTYTLNEAECRAYLGVLDRLGMIELRPLNRYRLKVAKTFRWRPNGPVMTYFRTQAADDFFSGGFDDPGDLFWGRALRATLQRDGAERGDPFAVQAGELGPRAVRQPVRNVGGLGPDRLGRAPGVEREDREIGSESLARIDARATAVGRGIPLPDEVETLRCVLVEVSPHS